MRYRRPPPLLLPAVLDPSKPFERQAYEFLCRATSERDRMWTLYSLRRQGDVLLCVVRWAHPESAAHRFSLAQVSLIQSAVSWRYFASTEAARAEMERRCASPTIGEEAPPTMLR